VLRAGSQVTVLVTNHDTRPCTLGVRGYPNSLPLAPGERQTLVFSVPAPPGLLGNLTTPMSCQGDSRRTASVVIQTR